MLRNKENNSHIILRFVYKRETLHFIFPNLTTGSQIFENTKHQNTLFRGNATHHSNSNRIPFTHKPQHTFKKQKSISLMSTTVQLPPLACSTQYPPLAPWIPSGYLFRLRRESLKTAIRKVSTVGVIIRLRDAKISKARRWCMSLDASCSDVCVCGLVQ